MFRTRASLDRPLPLVRRCRDLQRFPGLPLQDVPSKPELVFGLDDHLLDLSGTDLVLQLLDVGDGLDEVGPVQD